MEAMQAGEIARESTFNSNQLHWWETLYFPVFDLTMGEHDWKRMVKAAEVAGLIDIAGGRTLFWVLVLKKEFKKDTCMRKKLMQYLYSEKKEMGEKITKLDANMTKVMRYQKVQKVTSLVNGVISCVPFIGALTAHWVSGGATVSTEVAGKDWG